MRESTTEVLTWAWFSAPHGYHFKGWLVRHAGGNICIDPVEPTAEGLEELARQGVSPMLLTTRTHVRAATQVRARTGARTAIHPADADYARRQQAELDEEVRVGETIGPLVVHGVAGKSPGAVALHWPAQRLLWVGDAVIGYPVGRCSLLPERVIDDPAQLRGSIRQ